MEIRKTSNIVTNKPPAAAKPIKAKKENAPVLLDSVAIQGGSFASVSSSLSSVSAKPPVKAKATVREADFLFQEKFSPEKVWEFDGCRRQVHGSPFVDKQGNLYFGSDDYNVYKVDNKGKLLWKENVGGTIYASPVEDSKGNVLISGGKSLTAYSPDGKEVWDFRTEGALTNSPLIGKDGTIYQPSCDNKLYALNSEGEKKWEFEAKGTPGTPVADDKGNLYFGDVRKGLHSLTPDGKVRWSVELEDDMFESPTLGKDGKLYAGCSDGNVYCVDPKTGKEEWRVKTNWAISSSPLYTSKGQVIVSNQDGALYCIDPEKKDLRWVLKSDEFDLEMPLENSMGNIFTTGGSKIYCVSPEGLPLWKKDFEQDIETAPTLSRDGKMIYVGLREGGIMALERKDTAEAMQGGPTAEGGTIEEQDGWVIIGGVKLKRRK